MSVETSALPKKESEYPADNVTESEENIYLITRKENTRGVSRSLAFISVPLRDGQAEIFWERARMDPWPPVS